MTTGATAEERLVKECRGTNVHNKLTSVADSGTAIVDSGDRGFSVGGRSSGRKKSQGADNESCELVKMHCQDGKAANTEAGDVLGYFESRQPGFYTLQTAQNWLLQFLKNVARTWVILHQVLYSRQVVSSARSPFAPISAMTNGKTEQLTSVESFT